MLRVRVVSPGWSEKCSRIDSSSFVLYNQDAGGGTALGDDRGWSHASRSSLFDTAGSLQDAACCIRVGGIEFVGRESRESQVFPCVFAVRTEDTSRKER